MASLIERLSALVSAIKADVNALAARPAGPHAMEPGLAAGAYFSAAVVGLAPSTQATAANRIELFPIRPARNVSVDQLSIEVAGTLVAGSQARVGIYSAHPDTGLPDQLLSGPGDLLDCSTAGFKTSAISPALALQAGTLYWLAVHGSSTQTFRSLAVGALLPLPQTQTGNTHNTQRRATATFASGLPTTAPAATPVSAAVPFLKLRVA